MKILSLNAVERRETGFTHKVSLTYADLTAAAGSQAVQIFPKTGNLPAGIVAWKAAFRLVTNFSGGAASALTMSVGDGGSATALLAAVSVLNGATPVAYKAGAPVKAYTSADNIQATFTATGANLNTLTAGEIEIYLELRDLNDMALPK